METTLTELQTRYQNLRAKIDLDTKTKALEDFNVQMQAPGFWDTPDKAQSVSQKAAQIEKYIQIWTQIIDQLETLPELMSLANDTEKAELEAEVTKLEAQFNQAETWLLLSAPYDEHNVILSLHVGNGGQDAEDFCQMLLRMYLRHAEIEGWQTTILEESTSEVGLKSAQISIRGAYAYGLLKAEHGVHRLIRLSPFNAKSLRQTSFARVEVLPEIENETEVVIDPNDLRIDVFRSSGAGGQSVNTTDSAVRITYLPLNLIVTCQNEKSQHQNKDAAMKVLRSRLAQLQLEQQAAELKELRGDLMENSFGSQIRTYTLQPYKLVKDHRTDFEHPNPDKVFDGDLGGFTQAWLRQ